MLEPQNNSDREHPPPYYTFPNSRAEQYVQFLIRAFETSGKDEIYMPFYQISKTLAWGNLVPHIIGKIKNQLKYVPYITREVVELDHYKVPKYLFHRELYRQITNDQDARLDKNTS